MNAAKLFNFFSALPVFFLFFLYQYENSHFQSAFLFIFITVISNLSILIAFLTVIPGSGFSYPTSSSIPLPELCQFPSWNLTSLMHVLIPQHCIWNYILHGQVLTSISGLIWCPLLMAPMFKLLWNLRLIFSSLNEHLLFSFT